MQRYFIDQNADVNQRFCITDKGDIHHISNVMRHQIDDYIIITFADHYVYKCKIVEMINEGITVSLEERVHVDTELPQNITICSGLIKSDKYEWMLQKSTELGANEFIAVGMKRSVVKLTENKVAKKLERWQKIIKEAAEQSYRLAIPTIQYQDTLNDVLQSAEQYDYILIAYEDAAKNGEVNQFKSLVQQFKLNDNVLIIFGPEGGLAEDEIALLQDVAYQIGLGPRILRAETAPLYALSAISFEKDLQN